jgi:hypothetical protein
MKPPMDYLVRARREELADEMKGKGYAITRPAPPFDFVAEGEGKTVAFVVRERPVPQQDLETVVGLRAKAKAAGFTDYRLYVVPPPRSVDVDVAGLESALQAEISRKMWPGMEVLGRSPRVDEVSDIWFDAVKIDGACIHVEGGGYLSITSERAGWGVEGGIDAQEVFPFDFIANLDHDLNVTTIESLTVDTAAYFEPAEHDAV